MTISFSPEAEEDLVAVVSHLAQRNPTAARELGERIFGVLGEVVRSWPVPPVRIYYQRRGSGLWVLRVYHQSRPPIVR